MSNIEGEERDCLLEDCDENEEESHRPRDHRSSRSVTRRRKSAGKKDGKTGHKYGIKNGLRLLALTIANGLYLYLGGIVFYELEKTTIPKVNITKQLENLLKTIESTSHQSQLGSPSWSSGNYINQLNSTDWKAINETFFLIHKEIDISETEEWTLLKAVFFSSTVVTTIGYGNLAPATPVGRAFCVLYAIVGLPLTLILLAIVGQILANYINDMCIIVTSNLRRYFYPDYSYQSTEDETILKAPVWLAVLILCGFISLDAALFMSMENWTFGDSLYFVFITLTTIGFGDMVPRNTEAIIFNVTFLYIGLAIVSITLNLLTANIAQQVQEHKNKFNIVKNIEEVLREKGMGRHLTKKKDENETENDK